MQNSVQIPWQHRIQTKVSFFLAIFLTLILSGLGVYQVFQTQKTLGAELVIENKNTGIRLSNHVELPLWQLDEELILASVKSEMLNDDIYGIVVLDENKDFYLGVDRNSTWQINELSDPTVSETAYSGGLVSSLKEVQHKGKNIGFIEVFSSDKFNTEQIKSVYKSQLFSAFLLIVMITIVTFLVLRRLVVTPLTHLTDVAHSVSRGDFDVPLEMNAKDEVGELSRSINLLKKSYVIAMKRVSPI
ncbi:HAMP domain-containing protein [Leucothrix arctica]|nr:HAMP domain-containing protein [Leucothrix arctica]